MPSIRPYHQQVSASGEIGGRRAVGSDFSAVSGREGEGLQTVGAALYEQAERSEVSDAHARLATARAEWTVALAERAQSAAPGDPNFASSFNTDLAKYLEKAGGYSTPAGQRAYQQGASQLASHFVQQAGVYQARSMGEKAKLDYETVANKSSLAVYNDPTQFDSALASLKSALYDPNSPFARVGGARDELYTKAKERMALAAVKGTINFSPELAQQQLKEGRWNDYLAIENRDALDTEAKNAIRMKQQDAERLKALDEKARKQAEEATSRALTDKAILGTLTRQDLVKAQINDETKRAIFSFMKAGSEEGDRDAKTYGPGFDAMARNVWDGDPSNNPTENEIMLAATSAGGKRLTLAGAQQLIAQLRGKGTADGTAEATMKKEFFQGIEATISPKVFGLPTSPRAQQQYSFYLQWALPEYERLRKEGKSTDEIMGPKGVLTLGAERFKIPMADVFQDMTGNAPPDPVNSGKFKGNPGGSIVPQPSAPASVTVPLAPPKITTIDDYNALPPGSEYIDPDGKRKRKPK